MLSIEGFRYPSCGGTFIAVVIVEADRKSSKRSIGYFACQTATEMLNRPRCSRINREVHRSEDVSATVSRATERSFLTCSARLS